MSDYLRVSVVERGGGIADVGKLKSQALLSWTMCQGVCVQW